MLRFNSKVSTHKDSEIPLEGKAKRTRFRKLDKIYIISALILALGWGTWNLGLFTSIKLFKVRIHFISDYFAERDALKNNEFTRWDQQNFVVTKDYILYLSYQTRELYRMNRDGSENKKLIDGSIQSISVKDDWIYCVTEDKNIIKIKLDGSQRKDILKTADVNRVKVIGNYIYFNTKASFLSRITLKGEYRKSFPTNTMQDIFHFGNFIYRVAPDTRIVYKSRDGETDEKLVFTFEKEANNISLYKDTFYYLSQEGGLYRKNLEGRNKVEIANSILNYFIDNDTLYYVKSGAGSNGSYKLYKANLDGSVSSEVLSTDKPIISFSNGIAVCSDAFGRLSFINLVDRKEIAVPDFEYEILVKDIKDRIGDIEAESFDYNHGNPRLFSFKNNIYYMNDIERSINRYSKTDKKSVKIVEKELVKFEMLGNLIFYEDLKDGNFYCANSDGSKTQKLFNHKIHSFFPTREALYFTSNMDDRLYKVQLRDNRVIKISDESVVNFLIKGDYIYYLSQQSGSLYRAKLDGSSSEKLSLPYISDFIILGDYVYFLNYPKGEGGNPSLYRKRFDQDKIETVLENFNYGYFTSKDNIYLVGFQGVIVCDASWKTKNKLSLDNLGFIIDGEKVYFKNNLGKIEERNLSDIILN